MRSRMTRRLLPLALWIVAAAWPFSAVLFAGRMLYFRDITYTYYPDFVFLARSLSQHVWPLWHPGADAGAPFLAAYPAHLLLLLVGGPRLTLALSPPLHVLLAMCGTGALHRSLGGKWEGAALAGAALGLSGFVLGSVLYPIFLSASWAPLAIALAVRIVRSPSWRVGAALAAVFALEVSAFGVEALPQTVLAAAVLAPRAPGRRTVAVLLGSAAATALLAAPALVGGRWLLQGTARGAGFPESVALSYSASPPVLLEAVLPRFLGDPHTFSPLGYWGQPFFPNGSPLVLSLYAGPLVLLLVARARGSLRLWALVAIGVLLALGAHGPLGPVLAQLARVFPLRGPVKFCFLSLLGLALLAGRGLDRSLSRPLRPLNALLAPALVLGLALLAWQQPDRLAAGASVLVPAAAGSLARHVISTRWPAELAFTGILTLGAALALTRRGRLVTLAGLLAVLDLLRVDGELNPTTEARFYELRPAMREQVDQARAAGPYRWFSYPVASSPPLRWSAAVAKANSDVWLYYLDRQSLAPRTQALDGLDGAYDFDRMGIAPAGSTFSDAESVPAAYRMQHERLRRANVRWVVSFVPLPTDLTEPRALLKLPEAAEPLRLYELRDPLPRAYFSRQADGPPDPAGRVEYLALDAHTVELRADTPPGFVVVLDGYHPDWHALEGTRAVPVRRVLGRYRSIPTPGGARVFTMRFRPPWTVSALLASALGLLFTAFLATRRAASSISPREPAAPAAGRH